MNRLRKRGVERVGLGILSAGLATTALLGCTNVELADDQKLKECGAFMPNRKAGDTPIESTGDFLQNANQLAKTLQARALRVGGSINIAPAKDITTHISDNNAEVHVTDSSLTLTFNSSSTFRAIKFEQAAAGGDFKIGLGAVACTNNQAIYPNQVAANLQGYVEATKAIN